MTFDDAVALIRWITHIEPEQGLGRASFQGLDEKDLLLLTRALNVRTDQGLFEKEPGNRYSSDFVFLRVLEKTGTVIMHSKEVRKFEVSASEAELLIFSLEIPGMSHYTTAQKRKELIARLKSLYGGE